MSACLPRCPLHHVWLTQPCWENLTVSPGNLGQANFTEHLTAGGYGNFFAYPDGTAVTITLQLNTISGLAIVWGGGCAGASGNTCTITMNSDQSITAQISQT